MTTKTPVKARPLKDKDILWNAHLKAIKKLARSGSKESAAPKVDHDLLNDLGRWIRDGHITVHDENKSCFNLIQDKYPIGWNRIDWRGVEHHRFIDVLQMKDRQPIPHETEVSKLAEIRDSMSDIVLGAVGNGKDQVTWIGDACDLSLTMPANTLVDCYVTLFASGQHSYVFPATYDWCLSYTLEGCLYYGRAENSIATGPVDLDVFDVSDDDAAK